MPMTDKQLASRDAKRNLGAELLQSVREMKAGKGKVAARVEVPAVTHARMKSGLSGPVCRTAGRLGAYPSRLGARPPPAFWRGPYLDHHCGVETQSAAAGIQGFGRNANRMNLAERNNRMNSETLNCIGTL